MRVVSLRTLTFVMENQPNGRKMGVFDVKTEKGEKPMNFPFPKRFLKSNRVWDCHVVQEPRGFRQAVVSHATCAGVGGPVVSSNPSLPVHK